MSNQNRSRKTLALIIAVCAAPILASYGFYYWGKPYGTANYGDLLPVQPIPLWTVNERGLPMAPVQTLQGKWVLVSVDEGPCADLCRWKHTVTRQLRLMQGRDQGRISRLWITSMGLGDVASGGEDSLQEDAKNLSRLSLSSADLAWLPNPQQWAHSIYLVDPLGNLVMRFPVEYDQRAIRLMYKDVARLLRASRVG